MPTISERSIERGTPIGFPPSGSTTLSPRIALPGVRPVSPACTAKPRLTTSTHPPIRPLPGQGLSSRKKNHHDAATAAPKSDHAMARSISTAWIRRSVSDRTEVGGGLILGRYGYLRHV